MQTMHLQSLRKPNIALPLPLFPSRFVQPAKWIHRRRSRRHCSCGWERARRMQMTSREPTHRHLGLAGFPVVAFFHARKYPSPDLPPSLSCVWFGGNEYRHDRRSPLPSKATTSIQTHASLSRPKQTLALAQQSLVDRRIDNSSASLIQANLGQKKGLDALTGTRGGRRRKVERRGQKTGKMVVSCPVG